MCCTLPLEFTKFLNDVCVKNNVDCSPPRTASRLLDKVRVCVCVCDGGSFDFFMLKILLDFSSSQLNVQLLALNQNSTIFVWDLVLVSCCLLSLSSSTLLLVEYFLISSVAF